MIRLHHRYLTDIALWMTEAQWAATDHELTVKVINDILSHLNYVRGCCLFLGLGGALRQIDYLTESLKEKDHGLGGSEILALLQSLDATIDKELEEHKFMYMAPESAWFFERENAFGPDVARAFPAAAHDIAESGNCYAAARYTASVFHSMRALEPALELLAKRARVRFDSKRFDQSTWGEVLRQIEDAIKARGKPKRQKDEQDLRFLQEAATQFRYFKDIWRDSTMHAKSTYTRHRARDVMEHVKALMIQLSALRKDGAKAINASSAPSPSASLSAPGGAAPSPASSSSAGAPVTPGS